MNTSSHNTLYDLLMNASSMSAFFFVIGLMAIVISIAYAIRLWMVQTATFQMQKDLEDIKNHLLRSNTEEVYSEKPVLSESVSEEERKAIAAEKLAKLKPRKAFILLAAAVPLLLIGLFILLQNPR